MRPRREEVPIFGAIGKPKDTDLKVYNSQVFNASSSEENKQFLQVMRKYGPGQLESTIKPPESFFSSKDACLYIWVEWMGERTYAEEFMGEDPPEEQDYARFEDDTEAETSAPAWADKSIIALADRLNELIVPETSDGTPEQ